MIIFEIIWESIKQIYHIILDISRILLPFLLVLINYSIFYTSSQQYNNLDMTHHTLDNTPGMWPQQDNFTLSGHFSSQSRFSECLHCNIFSMFCCHVLSGQLMIVDCQIINFYICLTTSNYIGHISS